ncbi:sugar transferase [Anaerococcus tetradius]|uniref:sugar transferase n=1 Tax=Anaerococcus tetradius TaxID=33036 RepID=UPI0023F09104|nr:sugar transferase [Anaerococcus tetradius]
MRCEEVREYYDILYKKRFSILIKRIFDYILGILLLIFLAIPMIIIAVMIKLDSTGPVFYRQERVTRYGKHFKIHKFRTMVDNAENMGSAVTTENDSRVTKLGGKIRDYRLDELPQVIDVLLGDMSFVGTRPEAVKYVGKYKPEYYATLLLPAGITSEASIKYKDEAKLLMSAENIDKVYIEDVLQQKMKYNINAIRKFSISNEILIIIRTIFIVFGK